MHRKLPILALLSLTTAAPAVVINLDYSYSFGSFQEGTVIRESLEKAAADISAVLAPGQLAAVPTRAAPSGSASYFNGEFDLTSTAFAQTSYVIKSPFSTDVLRLVDETFREDEFRLYVGRRGFAGGLIASTSLVEIGLGMYGSGYQISWQGALDQAAANATTLFSRGGIIAQTINGALPLGNVSGTYSVNYGPMAASMWFAADGTQWQYDHNGKVAADQYDFYSVAVNQILIGLGATPPVENQLGSRTGLTAAHLESLRAVGWIVIPEPSCAMLLLGGLGLMSRRSRRRD